MKKQKFFAPFFQKRSSSFLSAENTKGSSIARSASAASAA
jgi:hypothetical protein